jgi:hypothetical protein
MTIPFPASKKGQISPPGDLSAHRLKHLTHLFGTVVAFPFHDHLESPIQTAPCDGTAGNA